MFQRTTTINKVLKLKKRVKGIQGGTSAGKTYGVIPILIDRAIKLKGKEISIVSESVPHLKRGVIKDFKKIMKDTNRWNVLQWNATDSKYTFKSGSWIEFFSADDSSKLRGARRDILYINETNKIDFESYQELAVRTKDEIFLDWNPTAEFWFHEHLQEDKDVDFLIVTYEDNEACPQSAIDYILKAKEKGKKSEYWKNWYKVYGLGQLGQLMGAVYEDWKMGEFDESLPYGFGLDFGFHPDPTALVKVAVDKKKGLVYVQELLYKKELTTKGIELNLKRLTKDRELIIADNAEKRLIFELKKTGLNCQPCIKGADSIRKNIIDIQSFTIIVCGKSTNLLNEINHYVWNDKKAGVPIDKHNHLLDAMRYAFTRLNMSKRSFV